MLDFPRPPSPPVDPINQRYINMGKLAEDFSIALRGCELADVMFIVGEDRIPLYGVKAVLACRSRLVVNVYSNPCYCYLYAWLILVCCHTNVNTIMTGLN